MMTQLRKTLNKITAFLSCLIMGVMTILVTWQVITRFVLNSPSTITEALAKYLFLWLVMIASAYVIGKRDHMNLQLVLHKLNPINQIRFGVASEVIIFLFVLCVLVYGGGYIAVNAMSQMDSALPVPVGVVYLALPAGGILAAIDCLCNLTDFIKLYKQEKEEGVHHD